MTRSGASPDAPSLKRPAVASAAWILASTAALLMAASFAFAGDPADDRPITASEISSMVASTGAPEASAPTADSAVPPRPASLPPEMPTYPTFTTPAVPPIETSVPVSTSPAEAQEIPQAQPDQPAAAAQTSAPPDTIDANNYAISDPDLINGLGSMRDFVEEGEKTSSIGFELRESSCRLKSGEQTDGLLIVQVAKGSPADKAGLRSYSAGKHHAWQALAIGAGMAFPPAMLLTMVALPMIEYTEAGKSYDMIIGVDGIRVNNYFDFQERMRVVEPGELVYFNLVRNGKRIQISVAIPALTASVSK